LQEIFELGFNYRSSNEMSEKAYYLIELLYIHGPIE